MYLCSSDCVRNPRANVWWCCFTAAEESVRRIFSRVPDAHRATILHKYAILSSHGHPSLSLSLSPDVRRRRSPAHPLTHVRTYARARQHYLNHRIYSGLIFDALFGLVLNTQPFDRAKRGRSSRRPARRCPRRRPPWTSRGRRRRSSSGASPSSGQPKMCVATPQSK